MGDWHGGDLWASGVCLMAEAQKRLRTSVAGMSRTATIQAYIGAVKLGMVVANSTTAEAPNVVTSDSGVALLSTLVASVWMAIVSDTNLKWTHVHSSKDVHM